MANVHSELSGRITRNDNHQGVHGVRVEVWDADKPSDQPRGVALTNRDGSYHIDLQSADASCCECPNLYIKLRDRDCRLIYDGCTDRRCCEPGVPLRIDVALAPQALWWHLQRPLSWERINEPLVPARVMQEIEDALELLQAGGLPKDIASLKLAVCATPPIEGFDRVLQEAWDALQGDPQGAQRYRDILDALCGTEDACCGAHVPFAAEVDALFAGACDKPPSTDCEEPESCAPCTPAQCAEGDCGCGSPFLSDDKVMLLVMAALHVACGKDALAKRYLQVLLGQFCRFDTLGALHAASLKALLGDEAGKAHARDLLELLCTQCPPMHDKTGCTPRHPPRCCVPCIDPKLARCLREAIKQWCYIRCYHICEVRPARACPGDEILIVGCGFGDRPGRIAFRRKAGASTSAAVTAKSWCDDRISVVVPQGAGCGLWLEMSPMTISVCDRFLELRVTGCIDNGFEGTSAEILRFDIKGHTAGECPLQPGEPLRIRWNTCAADHVRVELIDLANNSVIAAQDPAAPSGRWDFTATQFTRTVRLRVRITARGRCEPLSVSRQIDLVFQKRPNLQVQGLEVTQSIQHYRANQHLTDAADRGPDNSLRLVTNKTAWVRTYLRSGQDPAFDNGQLAGVNGTLRVERRTGGVWNTIATLAPQNGPIVVEDSFATYDAERGNINTTLNFVVPANLMTGLLRFTANVASPFAPCPGNSASGATQVDVNLQQTLNAAFITIGYNGPNATNTGNIVLAAPTLADCQAETSWAMTTYPVSGAPNVRIGGTFVTNTPLNDPRSCPGCCSPNWGPLLNQIAAAVAADQMANPGQWVYYGIIAGGIPVTVPGCSGGTATGGLAGAPQTYAHEIGHQFGLPHARCGNAGNGNPSYPVYEPYDFPVDVPANPLSATNWTMASIGEYGLNINNGAIANPNTAEDFMSYCGPAWMSVFTHNFLVNIATLTPQVIPTGSGAAAPRLIEDEPTGFERDERAIEPMIHVLGVLGTDGKVEVSSVARIATRYLRGHGRQTGYIAQHLDAEGRVIAQDTVYGYPSEGGASKSKRDDSGDCSCGGCGGNGDEPQPMLFKVMLRDTAPGTALRILKRGDVVWERKGTTKPPTFSSARATLNKNGDLELTWKISAESKDSTELWVRWTNDDGKSWHALTVGERGNAAKIAAEQLPSGSVRFELLAHDGFYTARTTTEIVALPPKPPSVAILYPRAPARVYGDRLLHLWGSASSFAGIPIDPQAAEWFIDDKPVGRSLDLWLENPGAGRHHVRLQVTEAGLTGMAMNEIEVLGDGQEPKIG